MLLKEAQRTNLDQMPEDLEKQDLKPKEKDVLHYQGHAELEVDQFIQEELLVRGKNINSFFILLFYCVMDVQITNPQGRKLMGFHEIAGSGSTKPSGMRTVRSGFTLQHNFGCDHVDAGKSHSPAAKMGMNKK